MITIVCEQSRDKLIFHAVRDSVIVQFKSFFHDEGPESDDRANLVPFARLCVLLNLVQIILPLLQKHFPVCFRLLLLRQLVKAIIHQGLHVATIKFENIVQHK